MTGPAEVTDPAEILRMADWEAAKSGPPGLDLGWWDWWSEAFGVPWPTDPLVEAYGRDALHEGSLSVVRRLVVVRVWARELTAALATHDESRAVAARAGLARHLR